MNDAEEGGAEDETKDAYAQVPDTTPRSGFAPPFERHTIYKIKARLWRVTGWNGKTLKLKLAHRPPQGNVSIEGTGEESE